MLHQSLYASYLDTAQTASAGKDKGQFVCRCSRLAVAWIFFRTATMFLPEIWHLRFSKLYGYAGLKPAAISLRLLSCSSRSR